MIKKYDEYHQILEAMLKTNGDFQIFDTIEQKLYNRTISPEQVRRNVLLLTTLAASVKDKDLKLELYEKILEEVVLYLFKVDSNGADPVS